LFPRPKFDKHLANLLNSEAYVVYHGPSEYGKSTAILHHKSINLRAGVLYLSLRGVGGDIAATFASALGLDQGSYFSVCMHHDIS
jgi:hypothetical protein